MKKIFVSFVASLLTFTVLPLHSQTPAKKAPAAAVRVKDFEAVPGREAVAEIELESEGNIGAVIFTLNFDPAAFRYVSSALTGEAPKSANLSLNTQPQHVSAGRLGVLMDTTSPFEKGKKTVLKITFAVLPNAAARDYQFSFGGTPAMQSLSTIDAQLVDTKFTPGTARVGSAKRSINGRVLSDLRYGRNRVQVTLTGPDDKTRTARTNAFGYFVFDDLAEGTYTVSARTPGYAFSPQTVEASLSPTETEFQEQT